MLDAIVPYIFSSRSPGDSLSVSAFSWRTRDLAVQLGFYQLVRRDSAKGSTIRSLRTRPRPAARPASPGFLARSGSSITGRIARASRWSSDRDQQTGYGRRRRPRSSLARRWRRPACEPHRFEDHVRQAFVEARQDQQVGRGQQPGDVIAVAQEPDLAASPKALAPRLRQRASQRAVADDQGPRSGRTCWSRSSAASRSSDPLLRGESAGEEDASGAPRTAPARRGPRPDRRAAAPRHRSPRGSSPAGPAGCPPCDRSRPPRRVAHHAVGPAARNGRSPVPPPLPEIDGHLGGHHDRHPRPVRRDPAVGVRREDPGLDHVELLALQEPDQAPEAPAGRPCAACRSAVTGRLPRQFGLQRAEPGQGRDLDLEPIAGQALRQQDHLLLGPRAVEGGDQLQDFEHVGVHRGMGNWPRPGGSILAGRGRASSASQRTSGHGEDERGEPVADQSRVRPPMPDLRLGQLGPGHRGRDGRPAHRRDGRNRRPSRRGRRVGLIERPAGHGVRTLPLVVLHPDGEPDQEIAPTEEREPDREPTPPPSQEDSQYAPQERRRVKEGRAPRQRSPP